MRSVAPIPTTATVSAPAGAGPRLVVKAEAESGAKQDYQDKQDKEDFQDQTKPLERSLENKQEQIGDASVLAQPLAAYIDFALGLPRDAEQSPLFTAVRYLKAHPDLNSLNGAEAVKKINEALSQSNRRLNREVEIEIMETWDRVRHVPFHDALQIALTQAKAKPLEPPVDRGQLYETFASLGFYLQKQTGETTIVLPLERLGVLLGCDFRTVSRLRKLAERDGLLKTIHAHDYKKQKATGFRFIGEIDLPPRYESVSEHNRRVTNEAIRGRRKLPFAGKLRAAQKQTERR